jgi:hypothetical protein
MFCFFELDFFISVIFVMFVWVVQRTGRVHYVVFTSASKKSGEKCSSPANFLSLFNAPKCALRPIPGVKEVAADDFTD